MFEFIKKMIGSQKDEVVNESVEAMEKNCVEMLEISKDLPESESKDVIISELTKQQEILKKFRR